MEIYVCTTEVGCIEYGARTMEATKVGDNSKSLAAARSWGKK